MRISALGVCNAPIKMFISLFTLHLFRQFCKSCQPANDSGWIFSEQKGYNTHGKWWGKSDGDTPPPPQLFAQTRTPPWAIHTREPLVVATLAKRHQKLHQAACLSSRETLTVAAHGRLVLTTNSTPLPHPCPLTPGATITFFTKC